MKQQLFIPHQHIPYQLFNGPRCTSENPSHHRTSTGAEVAEYIQQFVHCSCGICSILLDSPIRVSITISYVSSCAR